MFSTKNLKLEFSNKTVKSTGVKTKIPSKYKLEDIIDIRSVCNETRL